MTQTNDSDRLSHIESLLEEIREEQQRQKQEIAAFQHEVRTGFSEFKSESKATSEKFDIYRQANQSLVNLAFGLIASATIAVVVKIIYG